MPPMKLTEQQHRLWNSMQRSVENYKAQNISFPELVGALEGAFEAGEFRDGSLAERFYDLWQPLEITNAVKGNDVTPQEVAKDIEAMQQFLLDYPT